MAGSFKKIYYYVSLLSIICCSDQKIGSKIINQNMNIFVNELHWSTFEKNNKIIIPVFVSDHVTDNRLFLEECMCLDIINKEGFNVNLKTKYDSFIIYEAPSNIDNKSIKLIKGNSKIGLDKYVKINFNNFFVDTNLKKAFLIVEKIGYGIKSWTKEIYFFELKNNTWKFYKKELLLMG